MRAVSFSLSRRSLRFAVAGLVLAVEVATAFMPVAHAQSQSTGGLRDYPIPGGWFYSQESRLSTDSPPYRGYTVVDDQDASFWTEFRRFGGTDVLGYPVSQRYRYPSDTGYLSQAFQRGILQWHPETARARFCGGQGAAPWRRRIYRTIFQRGLRCRLMGQRLQPRRYHDRRQAGRAARSARASRRQCRQTC